MGTEALICVIGAIVGIYFLARPEKKVKKDKLTKELHSSGLPPRSPWNIP